MITWSNYKHLNTAKLLVRITPTGVVSFTPPLKTGSISDEEIVRQSGLLDLCEEGDAVMADKGFVIQPKGLHTPHVASLRILVERNVWNLKQSKFLSGFIPLFSKPILDRIIFVRAAVANLCRRSIK